MNVEGHAFEIRFNGQTSADAGNLANSLRQDLLSISDEVSCEITKDNQNTQDFGATLVLVLGTPAVVIIAKGISDFIRRTRSSITITPKSVKIEGFSGDATAKIVAALSIGQKD